MCVIDFFISLLSHVMCCELQAARVDVCCVCVTVLCVLCVCDCIVCCVLCVVCCDLLSVMKVRIG